MIKLIKTILNIAYSPGITAGMMIGGIIYGIYIASKDRVYASPNNIMANIDFGIEKNKGGTHDDRIRID